MLKFREDHEIILKSGGRRGAHVVSIIKLVAIEVVQLTFLAYLIPVLQGLAVG
jgi:hypothetical protein